MKKNILIVDDEEINRAILSQIFADEYNITEAENGVYAIECMKKYGNSLSAVLLDLVMPKMSGFDVLENIKDTAFFKSVPVILITGDDSLESVKRCFDMGVADFISKPFNPYIVKRRVSNIVNLFTHKNSLEDLVEKQVAEIKDKAEQLRSDNVELVDTLSSIVEFRNFESGKHIKRIRKYTAVILKYVMNYYPQYGINSEMAELIETTSAMHDIGKIAVPDSILLKKGPLTQEEKEVMKLHTTYGSEIIDKVAFKNSELYRKCCYDIARYHHERYDGNGYPDGLKGDEIPIAAQIVSVADVFDALVNERAYKPALSVDKAYDMILNDECGVFSPIMKECFIRARKEFEEITRAV